MDCNSFLKIIFILFFIIPIIQACNRNCHFEKIKWQQKEDLAYPYRDVMLDDLVTNYELAGLTYQQLTDLLGQPDSLSDKKNEVVYEIIFEYDIDVDPVYVKNLVFEFSPDSTVKSFKIEEYQRAVLKNADTIDLTITSRSWFKFRNFVDISIVGSSARFVDNFNGPFKSFIKI